MSFLLRAAAWSVLSVVLLVRPVSAEPVRVATWNAKTLFSTADVAARAEEFRKAGEALKPDILMLEEVASYDIVAAVRDAMGLKDYHVACSDFNQDDLSGYDSLEVAIISRFPLSQMIEYDATPDNTGADHELPELKLEPEFKLGIVRPHDDIRGFLWAKVDDLKLTLAVVHLKSSRGADGELDAANAVKREFVMAAVATGVNQDQNLWPEYTSIVAGDFNVGHGDTHKNGKDLSKDSLVPGFGDLYDDTHALLRDGIVGGLRMKNLVAHTTEATFPAFPSTPIDNIYCVGPAAEKFAPATIEHNTFGSDHRPVWTSFEANVAAAPPLEVSEHSQVAVVETPTTDGTKTKTGTGAKGEVIPVSEARAHLGEERTVEMTVAASRESNGIHFLNSDSDFRSMDNFVAVIFSDAAQKFAAKGIKNPSEHFRDKKIHVTGKIALHKNEQCQIVVDDPSQIEIVDK